MAKVTSIEARLRQLTLRANVAFAARCARRVQPLTTRLQADDRQAVDRAILLAETFARTKYEQTRKTAHEALKHAKSSGMTRASEIWSRFPDAYSPILTAFYALRATYASHSQIKSSTIKDSEVTKAPPAVQYAAAAFRTHVEAFEQPIRSPNINDIFDAATNDLNKLEMLELGPPLTLGEPVDPSVSGPLGPLWPNGAPEWFTDLMQATRASDLNESGAPPITLYFDASEFDKEEIANILGHISDLYRSVGGDALVIDRTETLDPSQVLEPKGV